MKKSKRKAPARKPSKPSTALARRQDVARFRIDDPDGVLDQKLTKMGELSDLAYTGGIGMAEVKLTAAERKVLARRVVEADVAIRPDGQIYLPHLHYTRWMIEAFGPTGWAIVPVAKPMRAENLMIVPHVLYIHRVPVAFAFGAAEYHEKNRRQTYDDVLESTTAYALRRTCKRIGMALELWDRRWRQKFIDAHCVEVSVKQRDNTIEKQWRRRDDPALPYEVTGRGGKSSNKVHEGEVIDPPAGGDGNGREKISKEQVKRLVGIWRGAGRHDADVQLWLKKRYGYTSTADIKRFDYDRIERELLARGELVLPGDE